MLVATRTLYVIAGAVPPKEFDVRVYQPEKDGTAWRCRYEIDWPKGIRTSSALGVDGVQALILALQKIGTELYTSSYHAEGKLRFDKAGQGYGFPVPKPLRSYLVGEDAVIDGD